MLGLLFFLLCLAFGVLLLRRLPVRLTVLELLAGAVVIGIIAGSNALFLPVLLFGYTYGIPFGLLLLLVGCGVLSHLRRWTRLPQQKQLWWLLTLFLFGGLLLWFNLTHDLQAKTSGLYSAGDTWGDIALHLTLASHFALNRHFSSDFPLLYGTKLTYPFMLDFFSGQLYRLGLPWGAAFALPSAALAISIVQLVLSISYRLFGRLQSGVVAMLLIIGSGSAAGWLQALGEGLTIHPTHDYSNIPLLNLQFTNLVTSVLLPQRGIVIGIAAVLFIILLLQDEKQTVNSWFLGLITVALPLFHVHSWAVAEVVLVGWAILNRSKPAGYAALIGLLGAAPILFWQIFNTPIHGFVHPFFGWMRADGQNILLFWLKNFGIFLVLFLWISWRVWRSQPIYKLLWILGAGLFGLTNTVILQPNPYDNIKLLAYWYIFGALLLGGWLTAAHWRLFLLPFLCASGFLTLLYDGARSDLLVSKEDIQYASTVTEQVPEGSRILTGQHHNDPVIMLSGRSVVEGYSGWLWTYGYDYIPIQQDVALMYQDGAVSQLLRAKYGIQYVETLNSVQLEKNIHFPVTPL